MQSRTKNQVLALLGTRKSGTNSSTWLNLLWVSLWTDSCYLHPSCSVKYIYVVYSSFTNWVWPSDINISWKVFRVTFVCLLSLPPPTQDLQREGQMACVGPQSHMSSGPLTGRHCFFIALEPPIWTYTQLSQLKQELSLPGYWLQWMGSLEWLYSSSLGS